VAERDERGARRRALLHHHRLPRQHRRQLRLEHGGMDDGVVRVVAHELFFALDQGARIRADLVALPRPAGRARQPRERVHEGAERVAHVALHGRVERVMPAHEHGVRPDLNHARLADAAVHALTADHEQHVGLHAGDLLEVLRHRVRPAVERVTIGEVHEDLPAREDRRLQRLR
jgi:hypothetical protein